MKKSVYFDTTVPSYKFDKRESLKYPCDITRKWWNEESHNFDIFTSLETVAELNRGDYPRKDKILNFAHAIKQLEPVNEIMEIAIYYQRCPVKYLHNRNFFFVL